MSLDQIRQIIRKAVENDGVIMERLEKNGYDPAFQAEDSICSELAFEEAIESMAKCYYMVQEEVNQIGV